jgi:divalent metal cation (Fe/Co/Zn/Cd) transporter
MKSEELQLYKRAYILSLFTIFYNIAEGIISMILGFSDETLALFGFGVDSFIEVISGAGIAMMVTRIRKHPESRISTFEIAALKLTGTAFYILSAGLLAGIIINIVTGHRPETAIAGIVISVVSILVMLWLMKAKRSAGLKLNSEPVIADSNCTKVCVYMSIVLLVSSFIYEFTGFAWADALGAAGLIYFSFKEGREAFEKARERKYGCC